MILPADESFTLEKTSYQSSSMILPAGTSFTVLLQKTSYQSKNLPKMLTESFCFIWYVCSYFDTNFMVLLSVI
jgi:hypothetical protein